MMTLRAVDTNVLLRYLTADDPVHSPIARKFIDEPEDDPGELLVTIPVVCELTWLLGSRRYGFNRVQISEAWERLLCSSRFRFQARAQVALAVEDFRAGPADLSDYLILHLGREEGANDVVTFDQAFAETAGVSDLKLMAAE